MALAATPTPQTVFANGTSYPIDYTYAWTWAKAGTASYEEVAGATGRTLTTGPEAADSGTYRCTATAGGLMASAEASVTIGARPEVSGDTGWPDGAGTPPISSGARRSKATHATVTRLGGETRYDTMSAIASEGWETSEWVVVACGETHADALCASGLAGLYGCPVVLTTPGSLVAQAKGQVERLGAHHVHIVGGDESVSGAVASELAGMGVSVGRVAGADRVATSLEALRWLRASGSTSDTIVVACGTTFTDGLTIGPWACATASPLILCDAEGKLSQGALDAIADNPYVRRIVLVGGTASVSEAVRDQLAGELEVVRLDGADRYETSERVAAWSAEHGLGWGSPAVATARTYVDAPSGAALCGKGASPLVLADAPADPGLTLLKQHGREVLCAYVLGGAASVGADSPLRWHRSHRRVRGLRIAEMA